MLLIERRIREFEQDPTPIGERFRRQMIWRRGAAEDFAWIPFLVCMHDALKRATDPNKSAQSQQHQQDGQSEVPNSESFSERSEALCRETSSNETSSEQRQCDVHARLESLGLNDREIAVLSRLQEGWSMKEAGWRCGVSKTRVFQLHKSALKKIQDAGLTIEQAIAPATEYVDPAELDKRARA